MHDVENNQKKMFKNYLLLALRVHCPLRTWYDFDACLIKVNDVFRWDLILLDHCLEPLHELIFHIIEVMGEVPGGLRGFLLYVPHSLQQGNGPFLS